MNVVGEPHTDADESESAPSEAATLLSGGTDGHASRGDELRLHRGSTIGRYVVLEELGAGGMGVVYAAYDPELDRKIAIKLLLASVNPQSGSRGDHARLIREAQAIAKINHPNVVSVHDVGAFGESVFIAMEFIEGESLGRWLERSRSQREILDLFTQAGRGLAAAHAADVVHRDFKPDNVLVGADGRARVVDFGLARRSGRTDGAGSSQSDSGPSALDSNLTVTGSVMGTPAYMAPEQHRGDSIDARTDLFAFCVSLYQALYGVRPFKGESLELLMANVCLGRMAPVPEGARVPGWLRRVLLRGLSVDPDARQTSMAALLQDLRRDPARKRRRVFLVGCAGVGAAGVALLGYETGTHREPTVCRNAAERVATAWNPERRNEVERAFMATGVHYAEETVSRVNHLLDQYARDWVHAQTEACEATYVHRSQSEELLDARMACLDGRLRRLQAELDVFVAADGPVMERAVSAAHGLPGVEGCADLEALRAEVEPPAATLRQEVETLENQLQEVEALAATGKYSAAKELAEQVAQQAEGVDYLPVQAHALHELGSAQERVEDPKAIETTRQAFTLALQARDDRRAIMAAIDLAHAHGTILRDDAVGRSWSDIGAALVARIGGDTRFEIGLATVRAVADVHAGRFSEAEAGFEHALHMQRKDDPENPNLVVTLMNFGGYHGERQNYAQAREYMGEALELSERLLGRHHPRTLSLYANLGLIAVLSGDHAEAEAKLTETYALQATVLGKEHLETARTLVGLAVAKRNLGKIEEAIELHREALAIRQAKLGEDHPEVCESLQNLATALSLHGESEEALALSRRALELVQKRFGLDDVATANAHRSLGALLVHMDRYSEGREHAASAVRIHEAMGGSEDPELIESLRTLGTAERELGRVRMALALHERALALSEANPHPVGTAYSRWALAKTLRVSGGEESRARALAQEALESLEGRSAEADVVQHIREWLRADPE